MLVIALAAAAWVFYPALRIQYREQKQRAQLSAELTDLQARNARLSDQVAALKTPEGVEDMARETLGMVREGERAYVVVEDTATAEPPTAAPDRVTTPTETVWTQVLDALFGVRD